MIRWVCTFFIASALSFLAYIRTDGFLFSMIQGPLSSNNYPLSSEGLAALSQNVHYLEQGGQCFVFQSDICKINCPR